VSRRSFYQYMCAHRHRNERCGKIIREALQTSRHFTASSLSEWALIGPIQYYDADHEAIAELIAEYQSTRSEAA
jgi:hypothetical protein